MTKLLDNINYPADLRKLEKKDLKQISEELRTELIDVVSETGGHLGAGLGVVELTVALHYVFNTPKDKLVWDVGHQCYPHKIITGRKENKNFEKRWWAIRIYQKIRKRIRSLVQRTVQLQFPQHLEWPQQKNYQMIIIMLLLSLEMVQ